MERETASTDMERDNNEKVGKRVGVRDRHIKTKRVRVRKRNCETERKRRMGS